MTKVGEQLLQPESGWKRYDDTDSNISYVGNWKTSTESGSLKWRGSNQISNIINDKIQFNFTGDKIRIIASIASANSNNIEIKIDNDIINTINMKATSINYQILVYEKVGMHNKEHFLEITNLTNDYIVLDAIDIDESGNLKSYNPYPNLHLIQDKNNNLYTLNESNLVRAPLQTLDENNFINNGFTDTDLITKDLLLNKFESLEGIKLLVYTDDLEKDKCEMIYNCEPYRPIDKLKKNSDICNILFKEV
ncbi:cell adhesion protein [Clostridium sporogenes]|nr:cell adhesion protein [Clostridium sporogenes]